MKNLKPSAARRGRTQPTPAVQGEPVAFCEDAALSIAERTFNTEVDEQLASDIIQYAQRLHSLYNTAPQPAEQQSSAGDSLISVPDEVFVAEFATWWDEHGQFCRAGGGTYERSFAFEAWRHLYPQLMNLQMAAAEQQREPCHECGGNGAGGAHEDDCSQQPDITRLVKALDSAKNLIANHSGEVLPDEYAGDQIEQIDAALAACRKGGEE